MANIDIKISESFIRGEITRAVKKEVKSEFRRDIYTYSDKKISDIAREAVNERADDIIDKTVCRLSYSVFKRIEQGLLEMIEQALKERNDENSV